MDWPAYATKIEGDLKTAEDNNSHLRQEVRGLQKQLIEAKQPIEAKADPDIEQELAKAQQEVTANKKKYIEHLNNLHGQLVDAGQARDAAVNQATEAESLRRELELTHLALNKKTKEVQQLRGQVEEQGKLLQQLRSEGAPVQKPTPGAVSYQDRISVLERQLKIQQRENAKLQHLSDCNPNKPNNTYSYDDSDDSEPEYPRRPQPPPAKKTPRPSSLLAGPCRPENYYQSTASPKPTTPKPAASHKTAGTPKPAATPSVKPAPTPKTAIPLKEAVSVDLTLSDDDVPLIEKRHEKPVESRRLPIRTSIHESIAVADHSPQTPVVPQAPAPPPTSVPSSSLPQKSPTTASPKRKRGAQEPPSSAKRRRSKKETEEEELRGEISGLSIDGFPYLRSDATSPKTKRNSSSTSQATTATTTMSTDNDLAFATAPMTFAFKAICTYRDSDTISEAYDSSNLRNVAADLWDRIEHAQNIWEKHCGEDWQHEFTKPGANPKEKYFCVTRKCQRKRTSYGKGKEPGMWACVDCVKAGLPCFTHTWPTEGRSEFQLLPLHEKDRGGPVVKDKEVEWWIKPGIKMPESDDEMEY